MKIYAPEEVSVYEPYTVKVHIINSEMAKDYDLIGVSGSCAIPLEYATGLKQHTLKLYDSRHFKYNGEKELEIPLIQITHQGRVDVWGVMENGKNKALFYECTIILKKSSAVTDYSSKVKVQFKPGFYKYTFGINDLPEGFNLETPDKNTAEEVVTTIYKNYRKESDNQKIFLSMKLEGIQKGNEVFSYKELSDPYLDKFKIQVTDRSYEEVKVGKETAHIHYYCENRAGSKFYAGCVYDGFILKPFGPVLYQMKASVVQNLETYEEKIAMEENWKKTFIESIENSYFKSDGKNVELKFEESEDDTCRNCKQGYVCGACGKCIKETNAVDFKDAEISVYLEIKNDGTNILNSIDSNVALTVFPKLEINYEDKKIDYCDLKDPGIKMTIKAEVLGNDTYSGFTSGFASDEREQTGSCEIDFKDPKCVFIVSPNSKKKFFDDAKNIIEEYKFTATIDNAVVKGQRTYEKNAKITLTPPKSFNIKLYSRNNQVQQGSNGVLEITPSGGTTENIIIKVTLLGPGKIGAESDKLNADWVLTSIKQKETEKIGYAAPALGNFDIGKELSSLSMTQLQTEAAKQIALDAVTAYGGEYAGNIEALVEAGEYSSKIGHLTDTFKAVNGLRNIKGTEKGIKDMTGELGDAMQVTDGKEDATWSENAADVGIVGISVAQTAVGVLTFIPNKIPGVSKLTAGLQTAFSAATNIWKANLQYISKAEKIERAKELFYPAVISVTAQDTSGWTVQELYVFQIAYHEVK